MNRSHLNLLIDTLAAAALVVMVATGYILRFPLPPATNRTHELWGLSRHEWGTIHSWSSLGLLAVLSIHLVLHWDWIFSTVRRRFTASKMVPRQRLRAGVISLALALMLGGWFAWSAQNDVRRLEAPRHSLQPAPKPEVVGLAQPQDLRREAIAVFQTSCISCHGPKKQRANFRADRREEFLAPRDGGPLIVPGDWEKSRLVPIISGQVKNMKAADDHALSPQEISMLKEWIRAGARWPDP